MHFVYDNPPIDKLGKRFKYLSVLETIANFRNIFKDSYIQRDELDENPSKKNYKEGCKKKPRKKSRAEVPSYAKGNYCAKGDGRGVSCTGRA
jgi:hypothetical protein